VYVHLYKKIEFTIMKIKHQELEIPQNNPFANCKLERQRYATVLTDIVNTYADGFVLAINNEWGTGKTTFVKMWQQHLKNKEFQTIYFNAWENDFDNNPLVAIMSELKTLTKDGDEDTFKSIVEKGAVLVKHIAPALLKAIVKKYVDTEVLIDTIENTAKGATEILEEEIKDYANKKKTIAEFRKELEQFIKKTDNDKPLVFIIDELDRCRPTYAVEVLEQMKHFFSVQGIVFVLSIDKNHLASSVRGFYGSEQINTDEYLRRFIDLEYSIPKPSIEAFVNYLFKYYSFEEFFSERNATEHQNDSISLLQMAKMLFVKSNSTLRQQEKIFGQTRLILNSFNYNQYTFSHLLFVLVFIKTMKNELYKEIENNIITLQELSNAFTDLVPSDNQSLSVMNLIYVEAWLLHFYNNNQEYRNKIQLFEKDTEGKIVSFIKSKLDNERHNLAYAFDYINQQWERRDIQLKYLLDKINLTAAIVIRQSS
jgi:Predicted P-loop ATPase